MRGCSISSLRSSGAILSSGETSVEGVLIGIDPVIGQAIPKLLPAKVVE